MSSSSSARDQWLLEIGKLLVATLIATVSATWTARGVLADYDRRISVIEAKQQVSDSNFSAAMNEIRSDVRELRAEIQGVATAMARSGNSRGE